MSTARTTYDDPGLAGAAVERDARGLLGRVMGFVAVTVGFTALGAYLGRDLSGATGLLLFIASFACIFALHFAAAREREQLAIALLFALGLLLGLAVAPVIADYANADPSALVAGSGGPPRRSSPPVARTAMPRAETSPPGDARCSGLCWA